MPAAGNQHPIFRLYAFDDSRCLTQVESSNVCPFASGLFTYHNVFKAHPCRSVCQNVRPLLG